MSVAFIEVETSITSIISKAEACFESADSSGVLGPAMAMASRAIASQ